jgi:copper chaperone CopZ
MKRIILILLAFLITFALTACSDEQLTIDNGQLTIKEASEEPTIITTELTVWGMVCIRCENKIINALSEIDGVISVSADSKADKVTVIHDPELEIDTINSIITGEGFNIP